MSLQYVCAKCAMPRVTYLRLGAARGVQACEWHADLSTAMAMMQDDDVVTYSAKFESDRTKTH